MTQPAVTTVPQQGQLTLAVSLQHMQTWITEPFATALIASGEALALDNRQFATVDPTIQDIISCDGKHLAGQVIRQWRGAFTIEFLATSRWLAWALAISWGTAGSPTVVAASTAVFTETVTATGGTRRIIFDGIPTEPIAYNASAATIETAVDAVLGANKINVTGTGPYVYTAAGAWLNAEVREPKVSTLMLTGGTSTLVTTTPGGAARTSYTITQSNAEQPPAITAVLGYPDRSAWRLQDLVVDTLTVSLEDSGLYRVRIAFVWQGLYYKLPSFTFPTCFKPKTLEVQDGLASFGSVDFSAALKAYTYTFNNRIDVPAGYTNVSRYVQRLLRTFPLGNETTAAAEEEAGSVYDLATANNQDGTEGSMVARIGSLTDGAVLTAAESLAFLAGTAQDFGGAGNRSRVPLRIRHFKSDGTATKPVSATVVTDYAGGFLTAA